MRRIPTLALWIILAGAAATVQFACSSDDSNNDNNNGGSTGTPPAVDRSDAASDVSSTMTKT